MVKKDGCFCNLWSKLTDAYVYHGQNVRMIGLPSQETRLSQAIALFSDCIIIKK